MLTQAGSGYSTCDGLDVTRWREDATSDCWGQYFYIRDLDGGRAWSAGRQPLGGDADEYEAMLSLEGAVFQRRDVGIGELRAQQLGDLLAQAWPHDCRDVAARGDPPVGEQRREPCDAAGADVDEQRRADHPGQQRHAISRARARSA